MSKLTFSRVMFSAALVSTIGIAGCDVDTKGDVAHTSATLQNCDILANTCAPIAAHPDYFIPGTHPRWNPAGGDIPLNTDLPFAGSVDGTAYIKIPAGAANNPVFAAINDLDGWSTNAAFNIPLSGEINPLSVNTNPVAPNVFVLALNVVSGGDPLNPAHIALPPDTIDTAYVVPVTTTVVSLDGGTNNVLRITPTAPLQGPRKYIVVVTNEVTDASDAPLTTSANYDLLRSEAPLADPALQPLRDAVDGWEQIAAGYLAARNDQLNTNFSLTLPTDPVALKSSLVLTYTFTTTDSLSPMLAMAAPRAALVQAQQRYGIDQNSAINNVVNTITGEGAVTLSTPSERTVAISPSTAVPLSTFSAALSGGVNLYTGTIALPYYQTAPALPANGDPSYFLKGWTANTTLGGAPAGAAIATAIGAPALPLADTDGSYNVTYRYPFAAATATLTVPLQVTLPDPTYTPDGAPTDCGNLYNGIAGTGYPVVIYIHGITSDRASVVALADALAKACIATVAIDLPMHGIAANSPFAGALNIEHTGMSALYPGARERHFDQRLNPLTGLPVAMNWETPDPALDGSGTLFINLLNFANTRDNLKQAVMDLLNLNASLGAISALNLDGTSSATDFDLSKVYVTGVSLGGIIGTTFTAINQLAYAGDAQLYAALAGASSPAAPLFAPRLNIVKALATSAPGGQLTKLLENSPAISPSILGALNAAGAPQGTTDFEKFLYTFQGLLDSADPINFASILNHATIPTPGFGSADVLTANGLDVALLMQEIVGGGDASGLGAANDTTLYVADKVVPNNAYPTALGAAIPAPLAGTDPLATLLGLTQVTAAPNPSLATGNGALIKLTIGHHASLLRPNENAGSAPLCGEYAATVELQTQIVSFLANDGANIAVGVGGPFSDGGVCTFNQGDTAAFIRTN